METLKLNPSGTNLGKERSERLIMCPAVRLVRSFKGLCMLFLVSVGEIPVFSQKFASFISR